MGGAFLQLINTGVENLLITDNPEINLFKYNYFRYVNFASESIKTQLNDSADFGKRVTVTIPKTGHLLSKLYLNLTLPVLTLVDGTYACWSDALGYSIFRRPIELLMGGVVVDKLYPTGMDILDELRTETGRQVMILKSDIYSGVRFNAIKPVKLCIPLEFWFTKSPELALPLHNMSNQEITLELYFNDFENVINYDGVTQPEKVSITDSYITTEYVFLDEIILETLIKKEYLFVIDQMAFQKDTIPAGESSRKITLDFKQPCKELLFVCIDSGNIENNNHFNYSRRSDQETLVLSANLLLDGKHHFNEYLSEEIFRQYYPNNVHSRVPNKHIYCIPFSIKPEDVQPTGFINLNRFDEISLLLRLNSNNPECQLYIHGIMHNIVRIKDGAITFDYSNS